MVSSDAQNPESFVPWAPHTIAGCAGSKTLTQTPRSRSMAEQTDCAEIEARDFRSPAWECAKIAKTSRILIVREGVA